MLSPDAAITIWKQCISLKDRLRAVSQKAESIARFLDKHEAVYKVRLPNKKYCGGISGGQISFHIKNPQVGKLMEKIIGQNSLVKMMPLHLACTFGTSFTTFEHFASNTRHRNGTPRETTNEVEIPNDIIRIGIGCEDQESIISELNFLLNMASTNIKLCKK